MIDVRKALEDVRSEFRAPPEPFEVRAWLRTPVAFDPLSVHFDAILAYAVLAEVGFPVWDSNEFGELLDIPLPLAQTGGVWHASAMWIEDPAKGKLVIYKRWASHYEHLVRKRRKINTGFGFYRAMALPIYTAHAPYVQFFACGDPNWVERLLKHVHAIGKKRSVGYGSVERWEIIPLDEDWSLTWQHPDVLLSSRSLPVDLLREMGLWAKGVVAELGVRPPYWHPETKALACFPWQELVHDRGGAEG